MKTIYIEKQEFFPKCFNCGGSPIIFSSANGKFQIKCQNCNIKTSWGKKTNVIIDWFLFGLRGYSYYEANRRAAKKDKSATKDVSR